MEIIKTSENVEFDVIYADGTRRRVKEGILHEVENEEMILHSGTSRPEVWIASAEDLLKYLNDIRGGVESLLLGMATEAESAKVVLKMRDMLSAVRDTDTQDTAEKQAIFRLGQMDMKESVIAYLEDRKKTAAPFVALTYAAIIQEIKNLVQEV